MALYRHQRAIAAAVHILRVRRLRTHGAQQCRRMPRVTHLAPSLITLLDRQDGVVSTRQLAAGGVDASATYRRIRSGRWQRLLPSVVATTSGAATRRQLLVAAWLWGGDGAAIDGSDACVWHGAAPAPAGDAPVHVVVPAESGARTRDFVVVRRAVAPIRIHSRGIVPYVDPAIALIVAARGCRSTRAAIAVLSRGLQLGVATTTDLRDARELLGDKWCRGVDEALLAVGVGVRSPAERDMRDLILTSTVLPEPLWNQWVDLGDGGNPVCLDALLVDAALVNEVDGKRYHAWGQQFERMHERHERLTAAGLTALHATPTRIRRDGATVLERLERTYLRLAGRGLPPGVRLVARPSIAR